LTIRAVIFDLGHTIWDIPARERPWAEAINRMHELLVKTGGGSDSPNSAELGRGLGLAVNDWETRYTKGEPYSQPPSTYFIEEALRGLNMSASRETVEELTEMLFGSELAVRTIEPDTRETLEGLYRRGLLLGCVTNTLLLEKAILDLLEELGIRHYFASVVVSSEAGFRKPHPSLFRRALVDVNVPASEAVFVGDSLRNDIAGAKAAGMRAVLTRQYRQESLEDTDPTPDVVIDRLRELPDVLSRLNATS
jgi:HAD superfamily hydrolase (TIGR01662 family)